MIPNQPYVQQSAVMPDYYQQMQSSNSQPEINKPIESENTEKSQCHCCVDLSQLHHFHYMHHFHPMYDFHHMHDFHPMHDFHAMNDFHHMNDFHPMHDFHPDMHEEWDPHMYDDHHHHPHEGGWEYSSIDYHHEWFHPWVHPHHPHHPHFPIVCFPSGKGQSE
jgi:hypothetical protein